MHKTAAILVCLFGMVAAVFGAELRHELPLEARQIVTNQSRSGLFTVVGRKVPNKSLFFNHFAGNTPLALDPSLLTVSCEQIKELLFKELGYNLRDQLLGKNHNLGLSKVFIVLHSQPDWPIEFSAVPSARAIGYRVDMPNELFASRLIETVVEILLIDMANAETHQADASPPVWLVKGLVAHLQAVGLETLPLEAQLGFTRVKTRRDPVAGVREHLRDRSPLTFEELSWPENLSAERKALYDDSAQLFVYELLHLKDGQAAMRHMITTLPRYKNWQFAFFDAYGSRFSKSIDVEKWWALTVVSFTGRDPLQAWSAEESAKKLDATLKVPAHVYASSNSLPRRVDLSFQQVIQEWDPARQQIALQKAVAQLRILRVRISPDLLPIADDYRETLETYLRDRNPTELQKKNSAGLNALKRGTCHKLDEIDRRLTSKKKPTPAVKPVPISSASAK